MQEVLGKKKIPQQCGRNIAIKSRHLEAVSKNLVIPFKKNKLNAMH